MTGFLVVGSVALMVGSVFVVWPRKVEASIEELFSLMAQSRYTLANPETRVVGAVLLTIGVAVAVYGLFSSRWS